MESLNKLVSNLELDRFCAHPASVTTATLTQAPRRLLKCLYPPMRRAELGDGSPGVLAPNLPELAQASILIVGEILHPPPEFPVVERNQRQHAHGVDRTWPRDVSSQERARREVLE